MIIENFKNQDPVSVYQRFRDRGRLAPEGLQYISSWVDEKLERCFQLMETADRELIDEWIANWNDLVEFDVYPVISSKEAAERVLRTEIAKYLDEQGRVKTWPSRRNRKYQLAVLEYLASKLNPNVYYTEKEVTNFINQNHTFSDPAMLRREMFEAKLLDRKIDGSAYWLRPRG